MPTEAEVLDALSGVRDPELDEPITDLEFVSDVKTAGDEVDVELRLPTSFCAPNFAYLMVHDAREALLAVPGVRQARVVLDDHHAAEEINAGAAEGRGFTDTFSTFEQTEGDGSLDELRGIFRRKAFVGRQEKLARKLLSEGYSPEELARMSVSDLPDSEQREKYLQRRDELGLDTAPEEPFLVSVEGETVPEEAVVQHLRRARLTRLSVESNGSFCRAVLEARHGRGDRKDRASA